VLHLIGEFHAHRLLGGPKLLLGGRRAEAGQHDWAVYLEPGVDVAPGFSQQQASFPRQYQLGVLLAQLLLAAEPLRAVPLGSPVSHTQAPAAQVLPPGITALFQPIGIDESEGSILWSSENSL